MRSRAPRKPRAEFDPAPHRVQLRALLDAIAAEPELDARRLDRLLKRHPKAGRGLFSKSELIAGLRAFGPAAGVDGDELVRRLRLRPVRTLSGVTPVTVLTRPFPCPGTCVFCPNDVRMPKSYLADEPGAQRAEDNRFDPYLQTWNRLDAYRSMGHPTDKVELIVLGGTWSHYPEGYQRHFVRRCFDALNDFGAGRDGRAAALAHAAVPAVSAPLDGAGLHPGDYNRAVAAAASRAMPAEDGDWSELEVAQRRNESAAARCVGLVLETRPDAIDARELLRLRRLGATKLQLGVQSLDDAILARNRRGHDTDATRRAFRLARGAGFKLHAHWMPNLLGATPTSDAADYRRLFADPDFRPDELKLYPCLLVPSAELVQHHARGEWRPYDDDTLTALLADCIEATPRWVRLTRVVRDFSAHDVAAGTHTANLREVAERELARRGARIREIRHREVRGSVPAEPTGLSLHTTRYATSVGEERFLEWVDAADRLAGFLRLALPDGEPVFEELRGCAVLREVHVYGASLGLGEREPGAAQHAGLGRALVEEAARQAAAAGYRELAVIAAVGTRPWYRRLGFRDRGLYPKLALDVP